VADIFRAHGEAYCQSHVLTDAQRRVMRDIQHCRTAVLGGHVDLCDTCGHSQVSYNSCRNRHCPKCQCLRQARWVAQRMERVLPTQHFHVVFTLPTELKALALRNRAPFFNLLFRAASRTLLELGHDPKRLGGLLGITAVLHTWTRELAFHPHLHCIVTGGALSPDRGRWVSARHDQGRYLFPVKVMASLFRGKLLAMLAVAIEQGEIHIDGSVAEFASIRDQLYRKAWVVYCKQPFGGAQQVFQYLGRYTHRVGISNQRLIGMDESGVTIFTKHGRTATLPAEEFIRRFLLHVLPPGFVKIRHFGLYAPGNVNTRLVLAQQLLASHSHATPDPNSEANPSLDPCPDPALHDLVSQATSGKAPVPTTTWRELFLALTGIDLSRCRVCRTGRIIRLPIPPHRIRHQAKPLAPLHDTS